MVARSFSTPRHVTQIRHGLGFCAYAFVPLQSHCDIPYHRFNFFLGHDLLGQKQRIEGEYLRSLHYKVDKAIELLPPLSLPSFLPTLSGGV